MSKKLFTKLFVFLLVVGLLFAVAPTKQAQAATPVSTAEELTAAIAGTETVITVTADISVGSVTRHAFSIPTGRTVTLDLNGHTISAETSNGGVFSNAGTLTISDNSIAKGGMIINTNTTQTTTGEAAKSAISNTGVLTVNAGVIVAGPAEGQGSWPGENFNPAYGIDNLNGGDVIINDATVSGAYGLRNFANGNGTTITITNGTITGKTGIAMQSFGTNVGTLIINGNTTVTAEKSAIYAAGVTQYNQIVINGGTFSGEDDYGTVCVVDGTLDINGGTFTGRNNTYSLINYYAIVDVTAGTFYGDILGGDSEPYTGYEGTGLTTFAPSEGNSILVAGGIDGTVVGADLVEIWMVHNTTQDIWYPTIQAAINAAANGDTIQVGAGTYVEQLLIQKNLTLVGAGIGQTIVQAPTSGRVTAPGYTGQVWTADTWNTDYLLAAYPTDPISGTPISVKVTGFTFDANSQAHTGDRFTGVYFRKVSNVDIAQAGLFASEIKGFNSTDPSVTGIRVLENSKLTLDGNLVKDYTILGVVVYGTDNLVDPIVTTSNNTLTPSGNREGIQYRFINGTGTAGIISNNTITNGGTNGIAVSTSDHVLVKDNISLAGSGNGITLESSSFCTVQGNTIANYPWNGIAVTNPWANSDGNLIQGNTITGIHSGSTTTLGACGWGIGLDNSSSTSYFVTNTVVTGNDVSTSDAGIVFYGVDATNVAHNNIIHDNSPYNLGNSNTAVTIDATNNWWGSAAGPVAGTFVGEAQYLPYCLNPECTQLSQAKLSMDYSSAGTTDTCSSTQLHTVDVFVQDVAYLTAYGLEVGFNPALVEVTAVANADWLDPDKGLESPGKLIDNVNGKVVFGWAAQGSGDGASEPVSGAGALIKITFKAKGLAGQPQFTVNAANSSLIGWEPGNEGMPIPFEVSAGESFNFGSVVTNTSKSPTVSYCDLAVAVAQATSGDTLRADVDFGTTARVNLNKTIIFNTNGHTITRNNAASEYDSLFYVNASGNLTVNGGGTLNSKSETATNLGAAIQIAGPALKTAKVTLEAGTTLSGDYVSIDVYRGTFTMTGGTVTDGIVMASSGTANITGGLVQGNDAAISSNSAYSGTNVTISATAVIDGGDGWAIYHPQRGNLNITGGTITGATGIEMRAGTLTISGSPEITTTGDAILINGNTSGYSGLLSATISGGEFTSTGGYALRETAPATTRTSNIAVSGGKFTGSLGAVQFTTVDPLILKLTAGAYNTDPGAMPDYVFEPLATYKNTTDNYYYIQEIIAGTIAAYDLPNGTETVTGDMVDFLGDIPWYNDDPVAERTQGNRVGVYITEPTGFDLSQAILTIGTQTWNWQAAKDNPTDNFVPVWKLITTVPQTTLMTVQWNPVSTQVFTVNVQTGSVLLAPPEPIITSTDIQGYYLAGEAREFNVKLEMPADGANYALMIFDYKLAGVTTADITKFEFFAQDIAPAGAWIDMGSRLTETYGNCTDNSGICGQFGWAPGGFGPIAAGFTNTTQFRVTFAKGFVAPLSFTLDLSGKLVETDNWTKLTTYTGSMDVYDKPTITFQLLENYFLTGDPQNFQVTFENPSTGGTYGHVVFQISIPAATGDITSLKYGDTNLTLECTTTPDVCTTVFDLGVVGGIPLTPSQGSPWSLKLTAAKAGTYPMTFTLVDLDSNPDRNLQSATGTATVYNKPVITAPLLSGPFVAGVPATVVVNVENVDTMFTPNNNFFVYLSLPAGTVYTYEGVSYTCVSAEDLSAVCPGIPVTLTAGVNPLSITITFPGAYNAPITVGLWGSDDVGLAEYTTPANVVVTADFTVTGNFSIQGNLSRAGVPVNFDWTGTLVDYDVDGTSSADSDTNLSVLLTYGGNYTITTLQPRYLNVYAGAGFSKMINLTGDRLLPELRLKGGNAVWLSGDNKIDGLDASQVGTDWTTLFPVQNLTINCGDVNFDGKVNIQDLALVGGNFDLTSADAYGAWLQ